MSWATSYINDLIQGKTVSFNPVGHSMVPLIKSGQRVTVKPIGDTTITKKDIVLCKVNGRQYLHLVTGIKSNQVQISNNKGFVNGWTSLKNIYGILEATHDD